MSGGQVKINETYHIDILGFLFEDADLSWSYTLHTEDVVHDGQYQRRAHNSPNNSPGDQTAVRCATNNRFRYKTNNNSLFQNQSVYELTGWCVGWDDDPIIICHIIWKQEKVPLEAVSDSMGSG